MCVFELPAVEAVRRGEVPADCSAERLGALLDAGLDVGAVGPALRGLRDVGAVRLLLERCGDDPVVLDALRLSRFAEPVVLENLDLFPPDEACFGSRPGEWSPAQWVRKVRAGEVPGRFSSGARPVFSRVSRFEPMSVEDWVLYFETVQRLGFPLPVFEELPAGDEVARVFHDAVLSVLSVGPGECERLYAGFLRDSAWVDEGWQGAVLGRDFPRIAPSAELSPGLISALSHVQPLNYEEAVGLYDSSVEVPHLFIEPSVESLQHPTLFEAVSGFVEYPPFPCLEWGGSREDMAGAVLEWFDSLRGAQVLDLDLGLLVSAHEDEEYTIFESLLDYQPEVKRALLDLIDARMGEGYMDLYVTFRRSGKFSEGQLDSLLLQHLRGDKLSGDFVRGAVHIPEIPGFTFPLLEDALVAGRVDDPAGDVAALLVSASLRIGRRPHPGVFALAAQDSKWLGLTSLLDVFEGFGDDPQFFQDEVLPCLRKARPSWSSSLRVPFWESHPRASVALLKEGFIQGEALQDLVSLPSFSGELDEYLREKLGDRPEVWRLYGSLLEDWEGSLPDLVDLARSLSEE